MNSEVRRVLERIRSKEISPDEGRRLLRRQTEGERRSRPVEPETTASAGGSQATAVPAAADESAGRAGWEQPAGLDALIERPFQAVVLDRPGRIGDLKLRPCAALEPQAGEVLIAVRAFSLNFGDLLCVKGMYPTMPDYPFTPGFEVSGTVCSVGEGVQGVARGADVIALMGPRLGGHSTLVRVPERFVMPKPANVSHEEACAFPIAFVTASYVMGKAEIEQDEKVLIQAAAGGVGLVAVQLALQRKAEVFATAGSQEKLDFLRKMGVQHPINYREEDFAARIRALTGGYGVDVLLNTLSGDVIQKGLDLLAPGGRYFEIAVTGLMGAQKLSLANLVQNQTFHSVDLRRLFMAKGERIQATLSGMQVALAEGAVRSIISHVFPLPEVREAYAAIENRANIGKIVVRVPDAVVERVLESVSERAIGARAASPLESARRSTAGPSARSDAGTGRRIAIIGLSCRLPGARSPREFWELLRDGRSAIREIPAERWDIQKLYDPDPRTPGKTNCRWGGFLDDIDKFDPLFFSISGSEAELMDPQQRLFLQESWRALEDAGYANDAVSSSRCSVFAGVCSSDYMLKMHEEGVELDAQALLGNECSILPARISYLLNLKGPSVAVNTACSSSLVALHLACQSILLGQCDMALAGGVSIFVTSDFHVMAAKGGMLSPDGRCKTFDEDANGFVPGEGVGVVVLKALDAAERDGDHIYGVILGSDTNQDGKTNGITAPSTLSQTSVQLSAYRNAGISPDTIDLVEAHGTGTKLGDPIEIEALSNSFARYTSRKQYCAIGSAKTNVGHTCAAAGVVGVIKVLLALQHGQIPPTINFRKPNEKIRFQDTPFFVCTSPREWPRHPDAPRRGAVSAFGFSGTNVHVVIEEAPPCAPRAPGVIERDAREHHLILASAKTEAAMAQKLADLAVWLEREGRDQPLGDIAFTLHACRKHFPRRSAFVARDRAELLSALRRVRHGERPEIYLDDAGRAPLRASAKEDWTSRLRGDTLEADLAGERRREALLRLAELYVSGLDLESDLLHRGRDRRRLSMPVYPFAQERYWMRGDLRRQAPPVEHAPRRGHPLTLRNVSTFDEQRYVFQPDGSEFFINDHVIGGTCVLAGVVAMEMARAAGELTRPGRVRRIRDMTWSRPILAGYPARSAGIQIRLRQEGAAIRFDIDGPDSVPGGPASATGVLLHGDPPELAGEGDRVDVHAITARCSGSLSGEECYGLFRQLGFEYGPGFQAMREVRFNDAEVLARLQLPASLNAGIAQLVLHPSLMDGALQSMIGLIKQSGAPAERHVPYSVDEVEILGPLSHTCFAHLVRAPVAGRGDGQLPRFDLRVTDEAGRVLVSLRGLTVVPASAPGDVRSRKGGEALRYARVWKRSPVKSTAQPRAAEPALVLDLDGEAARRLRERAARDGQQAPVTLVLAGAAFRRVGERDYEIDPGSREDYTRLLQSLPEEERPRRILVLWGRRDLFVPDSVPDLRRGFHSLLFLVQALMKDRPSAPSTLCFIYVAERDNPAPHHAALGAFARTARLEDPDLHVRTIGLPADAEGGAAITEHWEQLMLEWERPGAGSVEVVYRGGERWERGLVAVTGSGADREGHERRTPVELREQGVYLITGGAGGLGMVFARHLARKRAKLILIGRSSLTPERQEDLSRLQLSGASVLYEPADVADRVALERAIRCGRSRFGPINGVIHAAGVLRDSFLRHKTLPQAREVLAPKIDGTLWLDHLTREDRLDFMVLFSSLAAVVGSVGQADYAFANAFMDEFAASREAFRRDGRRWGRTVAIDWGFWESGGMKPGAVVSEALRRDLGLAALRDRDGLRAFEEALASDAAQIIVVAGDPATVGRALGAAAGGGAAGSAATGVSDALRPAAEAYLREILAEQLRLPVARIDAGEPLETYGIDSVMVMRLSRRLEADFGDLPKTLFFEYQNLRDLSSYFVERHGERLARKLGAEGPGAELPPVESRPMLPASTPSAALSEAPAPRTSGDRAADHVGAIAIVGVSGRYPMADDLETFWKNLAEGRDCITEIPPDRWALDGFYSPEKGKPGRSYSKWGGFLNDVDKFDALFFKIAPREADMMDPQERLFLETVWSLLEDAGYTRSTLSGARTGVFVGVMYGHYQLLGASADGRLAVSSHASIANRVSYFFDLHGPSLALDTMCSSSLTAIHLACESIRRGECDIAIAGGVNVTIHPNKYLQLSLGRFASSDGRCRSFGDGGDGYVPGEGVGAVLLKPLSAALADGDTIHAIVRGTAINHGGKTNGYTVPNPNAQAAVIAEALGRAVMHPAEVSYVEAHGTGTSLGDPIEIAALTKAYRELTGKDESCPVGSVKSSIGHLESAAGIAAVSKVILQMRHGTLAPSLHAEALNPNLDLTGSPFHVQRELSEWKRPAAREGDRVRTLPRVAGVSSFGAGGSNAHVLLEEHEAPAPPALEIEPQLIVLSAKTREGLAILAGRHASHLERGLRSAPGPWRTQLRNDLSRRVCELLGLREGDIGPEDELRECGLDDVARARLSTIVGDAYGLEWAGDFPVGVSTIVAMVDALARGHEARLRARFGAEEPSAPDAASAAGPRLADIAFTLQVGREAMEERLALVASDLVEVCGALCAFSAGAASGASLIVGRVGAAGEGVLDTFSGSASEEGLRALVRVGALDRIARRWVQGASVDWLLLHPHGGRRRVSLPGYPFARERHWLPVAGPERRPSAPEPLAAPEQARPTLIDGEIQGSPATEAPGPGAIPGGDHHPWIVRELIVFAADLVGLSPERLDPSVSFGDYGFESVALKELAGRISSRFGVDFPPTLFFERPSIDRVASWLADELGERMDAIRGPLPAVRPDVSASPPAAGADPRSGPKLEPRGPAVGPAEPIAVIGMSGRFPGSRNLTELWENLRTERDLITEVPGDRWDWRAYDNDALPPDQRCRFHWGGFIDDIDMFDPLFFGISPAEAELMDPQQRIFLQAVWGAIEDAGYRPSSLAGKSVGVFAGVQFSDYQHLLHEAGILTAQSGIGNEHSILLNRISYLLDLRGPSEPSNTACSSSLVAVHRAIRSLRSGECVLAIAGGVAANLSPASTISAGKMGILSPDGKCRTLDRSANGYVKGEGVGVVVLKPLRQALADGDHIHALIRGTAVNHGGRAASLTAPSPEAQATLIKAAVEEAGISHDTIGYLELHGTGTEIGDPVEINGIKSAFRQLARERGGGRPVRSHCGIGSVKTNIGHLEPASGIAGMMKIILAMQSRTLPGTLHLSEVNPYIDLRESPLFIVRRTMPWERLIGEDGVPAPLRAGVSSFGFGGVNAHAVLEEFVPPAATPERAQARAEVFVFSARTAGALEEVLGRFLERIDAWERDQSAMSLADIAYTLQVGREEMSERAACVARDRRELRDGLERLVRGESGARHVYRGRAAKGARPAGEDDADVLAERWVDGGAVEWSLLHRGRRPRRLPLPTYPFARKRYWFSAPEGNPRPRRAPQATEALKAQESGGDPGEVASLSGEDHVRAELRDILVAKLKIEEGELEDDRELQEYGADSILGAVIVQAVQERFGGQVPLNAVTEHPTLRALSRFVHQEFFAAQEAAGERPAGRRSGSARKAAGGAPAAPGLAKVRLPPELLPINTKGSRQTSFWVPGATGHPVGIQSLSDALGPDYPVFAFQARGTDGRSMPQLLDEMVEHYVRCVRLVQPKGPYVLGGYSFGGLVAIEMARRLDAEGETIRHLIMLDTYPATREVFDRHFNVVDSSTHYDADFLPLYLANNFLRIEENPHLSIRMADVVDFPKRLQLARLAKLAEERGGKRMSVDDIFLFLRGGLLCSEFSEGIYQAYESRMRSYGASEVLFFKATDGFVGRASAMYWTPIDILGGYDYIKPWRELIQRDLRIIELDNDHFSMLAEPTLTVAVRAIEAVLKDPPQIDADRSARFDEALGEVTRFGHALLAHRLRGAEVLPGPGETIGRDDLRERLNVLPQYDRLFHALIGILEREGYLRREGDCLAVEPKLAEAEISGGESGVGARAEALASRHSEIKGYLPLLTTCQAAVLEVIDGRRDPADVLFPAGSTALVASVSEGSFRDEFHGQLVADRVHEHVRQCIRQYKHARIQLFEIGAEPGGASVCVLEALKAHAQRLRYLHTNVGPALVRTSREQLATSYPFAEFVLFGVERPLEAQGFEPGTMDVVVASNVLHATRRIAAALAQCRRLLKPGGALIIRELTQPSDYDTLTFGLTTGWWLYEDEEVRIGGSPLLTCGGWARALEGAGFSDIEISGMPGVAPAELRESVIRARRA